MASLVYGTITLDLVLFEFQQEQVVPKVAHRTPYGTRLTYSYGVSYRTGRCVFRVRSKSEYDDLVQFHKTVVQDVGRFTFNPWPAIADSGESWDAAFESGLSLAPAKVGEKLIGDVSVDISEAPL